jgi:RimJ/RimL family protein N-acetyltransferase
MKNDEYRALTNQVFTKGEFKLIPIRQEDRYPIMKWRNEQLYHLRQEKPLTKVEQDFYFNETVKSLFDKEKPDQILFSFLKDDQLVGYGGLVHIDWKNRNAEISFIMDTSLESEHFSYIWERYLELLEIIAFSELEFHKIFAFAYNLRPHLFEVLNKCNYEKEAILKEHCFFEDHFLDVIIYSKILNHE